MPTYLVTLVVETGIEETPPGDWNWPYLLDSQLPADVLECSEIEPGEHETPEKVQAVLERVRLAHQDVQEIVPPPLSSEDTSDWIEGPVDGSV